MTEWADHWAMMSDEERGKKGRGNEAEIIEL